MLEYKDVVITLDDSDDTEEVLVAIGDGKTEFNSDYEFDARIYFYFQNEAEFNSAKTEIHENIGFKILEVKEG